MPEQTKKQSKRLSLRDVEDKVTEQPITIEPALSPDEKVMVAARQIGEKFASWDHEQCEQACGVIKEQLARVEEEISRGQATMGEALLADQDKVALDPFSETPTENVEKARKKMERLEYAYWSLRKALTEVQLAKRAKRYDQLEAEIDELTRKISEAEAKFVEVQNELSHLRYQMHDAQAELREARIGKHDVQAYIDACTPPVSRVLLGMFAGEGSVVQVPLEQFAAMIDREDVS